VIAVGEVAGAGLLAHVPTIMLPHDQRLELQRGQGDQPGPRPGAAAGRGLRGARLRHRGRARLALAYHRPSSSWPPSRAREDCSPPTSCRAACAGSPTTGVATPSCPAVAGQAKGNGTWITAIEDPCLPVHYATVNLWHYLGRGLDKRWVSMSTAQTGDTEDLPARGPGARRGHRAGRPDRAAGGVRGHVTHVLVAAGTAGARGQRQPRTSGRRRRGPRTPTGSHGWRPATTPG
jgi:hypothetical protein